MNTFPTQRVPDPPESTTPEPTSHIVRTPGGGLLLVTVHDADTVQVRMRLGDRWSAPFETAGVA